MGENPEAEPGVDAFQPEAEDPSSEKPATRKKKSKTKTSSSSATVEHETPRKPWVDFCPACNAPASQLKPWPPGSSPQRGRVQCQRCNASILKKEVA